MCLDPWFGLRGLRSAILYFTPSILAANSSGAAGTDDDGCAAIQDGLSPGFLPGYLDQLLIAL